MCFKRVAWGLAVLCLLSGASGGQVLPAALGQGAAALPATVYFPLAEGNFWLYRSCEILLGYAEGDCSDWLDRVLDVGNVDGSATYRVQHEYADDVFTYAPGPDGIYILDDRDFPYPPYTPGCFLKSPLVRGDHWTFGYPHSYLDRWNATVLSVSDLAEVPAGTFTRCAKVRFRTPDEPSWEELAWFAPYVGKVKDDFYEFGRLFWRDVLIDYQVDVPDTTPPAKPVVSVETDSGVVYGPGVSASWSASDFESRIESYLAAVADEHGLICDWRDFGRALQGTLDNLPLEMGRSYSVVVKAVNAKGLESEIGASRPFKVGRAITRLTIETVPPQAGPVPVCRPLGALRFKATAYDTDGTVVTGRRTVWECLGGAGRIDSAGRFTAGRVAASYPACVRASVLGSTLEATSDLNIEPGPPSKVTVEPSAARLPPSSEYRFVATIRDAFGNRIENAPVVWSLTNARAGKINPATGNFTAGNRLGHYSQVVRARVGNATGTATVTVLVSASRTEVTCAPPYECVPYFATVPINSTISFVATAYDYADKPIDGMKFLWRVGYGEPGNPTVRNGVLRAGTRSGQYQAVAIPIVGGEPDEFASGRIWVVVPPGPPGRIWVTSGNAEETIDLYRCRAGERYGFDASVYDRYGNLLEVKDEDIAWSLSSSDLGDIDADGIFRPVVIVPDRGLYGYVAATVAGKTGRARIAVVPK